MTAPIPSNQSRTDANNSPLSGLLTKEELAAELRCSPRQIERLQQARKIPFVKISGRMIRYRRETVLNALARIETEAVNCG